ncbi:hypothetical protein [Flavihumibacter petaseus]|uniref:Lipocalin-like domain-containing protein n=1 Tax=Flavihumibacter petaseus NBRC 106054 TaxID=1220578 RepID=A0A0E9MXR9_9BACT|nr:hypothetical protein [Flavihumibacter petaseus]GAO42512.1 hypothetical protein FPE01S_01_15270 [Flavihumibacter petaseus NBRC 106054]
MKKLPACIVALSLPFAACQLSVPSPNTSSPNAIIGKWEYKSIELEGYDAMTDEGKKFQDTVNQTNSGLTIRFSPSREFESDQPGGLEENNKIADYALLPDNLLVIEQDTVVIHQVNDTSLVLYRPGQSFMIFKRIGFTGTEPGRR